MRRWPAPSRGSTPSGSTSTPRCWRSTGKGPTRHWWGRLAPPGGRVGRREGSQRAEPPLAAGAHAAGRGAGVVRDADHGRLRAGPPVPERDGPRPGGRRSGRTVRRGPGPREPARRPGPAHRAAQLLRNEPFGVRRGGRGPRAPDRELAPGRPVGKHRLAVHGPTGARLGPSICRATARSRRGERRGRAAGWGRSGVRGPPWIRSQQRLRTRPHLSRARAIMRERRSSHILEGFDLRVLAEASLGAGDPDGARETAELALAHARQHHTRVFEIGALLAWARVHRATDGADGAAGIEAALRDAMALVEAIEARAFAPFIHVERAALAHLLGDATARQRELREAHRLFTEMGAPIRAEQVSRELA